MNDIFVKTFLNNCIEIFFPYVSPTGLAPDRWGIRLRRGKVKVTGPMLQPKVLCEDTPSTYM
jgi:hypothetical protein